MEILVIGASSEIAREFINYCFQKKHKIFLVTRTKNIINKDIECLAVTDYLDDKIKISNFLRKLENPTILFFNGKLFENRPYKVPTNKEIELTKYINYSVPYKLFKYLNENNKNINKFVFTSSMAAIRLRNKNFIYGTNKRRLEEKVLSESKYPVLVMRFGLVFTKMSQGHKVPPFSMSAANAAKKIYINLNKEKIVYGNFGLNMISKLIILIPEFIFKRIKI